jgi:hypothetical protein
MITIGEHARSSAARGRRGVNEGIVLTGWVVVGIIWLFFSTAVVVSLPLWQSRKTNSHTIKIASANMTGKGGRRGKAEVRQGETADADGAPPVVEEKSDAKQREIEKRVLQCLVMTERDQLSKARLPYKEAGL